MRFIADLHIHSHFSMATSKQLKPEFLEDWAGLKGIKVVGTGDFTHPGWLAELKQKLLPAESGLFKLNPDYRLDAAKGRRDDVRFMLTAEISNIYKRDDKTRKVHNVVFAPDFDTVEKIQRMLGKIGNITSDGRPILGLDSRNLLEIVLEANPDNFFVPAHIWTPWFSALGAKSGFDRIEACYGDLTRYIYAVETGLSSDPPMNWLCSFLDRFTLISNSDAHSPEKLGREANLFDTDLSYEGITEALMHPIEQKFLGTIEFFPQEGKYHYDGHRKCGIRWDPLATLENDGKCPVCGKPVTVGVMHRVAELADRPQLPSEHERAPFFSLIPLKELLGQILAVSSQSKKVAETYQKLLRNGGSEFDLLLDLPLEDIRRITNSKVSEAIYRMREGRVQISEGYDGEYGVIRIFDKEESNDWTRQSSLFSNATESASTFGGRELIRFDIGAYRHMADKMREAPTSQNDDAKRTSASLEEDRLNTEQQKAVRYGRGPLMIVAGPGTGKTRVLTHRIAYLIREQAIDPENILAVTFTNKAANEMRERLNTLLANPWEAEAVSVKTFHAFGHEILSAYANHLNRTTPFTIIDDDEKRTLLIHELNADKTEARSFTRLISDIKQKVQSSRAIEDNKAANLFELYNQWLAENNCFDMDDLIYQTVRLLRDEPNIRSAYRKQIQWLLIDEFQDINAAQYQLVRELKPESSDNITIIGDQNQAIYGFRGADVRFMEQFHEDYKPVAVYSLRQSYRCSNRILRASAEVMSNQPRRPELLSAMQTDVKIQFTMQQSDRSEAEFVARTIEQFMGGLRFFSMDSNISSGNNDQGISSLSDFAVLCRIGKQMPVLEKALLDHSIPYQTIGEQPFLKQPPCSVLIDILRTKQQGSNPLLKRKIEKQIKMTETMWRQITEKLQRIGNVREELEFLIVNLRERMQVEQNHSFNELLDWAETYGDRLNAFLRDAALSHPQDAQLPQTERVRLMTMHAAKGLEFKAVFIVGCEEGLLPYALFGEHQADVEEERRLLYVGMTRARFYLFFSHARKRQLMGRTYYPERSRFLRQIEEEHIERLRNTYKRKPTKDDGQLNLF